MIYNGISEYLYVFMYMNVRIQICLNICVYIRIALLYLVYTLFPLYLHFVVFLVGPL